MEHWVYLLVVELSKEESARVQVRFTFAKGVLSVEVVSTVA